MQKKSKSNGNDKPIYWLDEEAEFNKDGNISYYAFDSERLLFDKLDGFVEGTMDIGDVVLSREFIESTDNVRICYTEIAHKTETAKATIAMFHGMGQNTDMHTEFAINFALNGYKVQMIDFRGFGWSTGIRADNTLLEMQKDAAFSLQKADPELPLFVYCHSMGCLIVTSFLMNNPKLNISGAILSAPLVGLPERVKCDRTHIFLANFLSNELPELIFNSRIDPGLVSKSPLVLRYFLTNRRIVPIIGTRQVASLLYYALHYKYNSALFKYPILIHMAGDDGVVDNKATKQFYERLGTEDKKIYEYENNYHELQYESCKREVFKNTMDWLSEKLNKPVLKKFGVLDIEKGVKFGPLQKSAPFKHWKQLIAFLVALYYFIGYLLMVSKIVNKDRHEMIAFWPCSLFRRFFGKK